MKILTTLLLCLMLTGCPTSTTTPTQALAPGYSTPADQTMGQTLAAADAFYRRIQTGSAAGKVTLSAAEKTAMNDLGTALNLANGTYLAFHNGSASAVQAQSAIDAVQAKQQAVQALGVQ